MSQRPAYARFIAAHPEYAATAVLDDLRRREFSRIDAGRHVYLDYTGAGLYAASQLREHSAMLDRGVYIAPSQFEVGFMSLAHTDAATRSLFASSRPSMSSALTFRTPSRLKIFM